jgi:hypothetical protein
MLIPLSESSESRFGSTREKFSIESKIQHTPHTDS